jgi:PAS domain S-box-containing protein
VSWQRAVRLATAAALVLLLTSLFLAYRDVTLGAASRRLGDVVFLQDLAGSRVLISLTDATVEQRNYLLTGDPVYLRSYDAAVKRIPSDLAVLRRVSPADPVSSLLIARLRGDLEDRIYLLAETLALRQAGHGDLAVEVVRAGRGRSLMLSIAADIDAVRASNRNRQRRLQANALRASGWVAPAGPGVVAGLLLGAVGLAERRQRRKAGTALARREKFVRAFGLTPGMLRDLDGRITFWATGMQMLYGYAAEEAVGRTAGELLDTRYPAPLGQITADLLAKGEWVGELTSRHRDGGSVTVVSRWVLHRDEVDGSLSVVEMDHDVGRLRLAETHLQLALDASEQGTWQLNLESEGGFSWDGRAGALLGVSADQPDPRARWVGTTLPEDLAGVESGLARIADPADPQDSFSVDFRVDHGGGRIAWVHATGRAQFRPDPAAPAGRTPVSLVGTVFDISDTVRANEQLRQSATLLRAIVETAPGLIYAKDRQGRMLVANGAVLALIGKPWSAVEGRTDAEFLDHPEQGRVVMANDRRVMEQGISESVEEQVGGENGHARVWLSTKTPMRDANGEVVGLVGISVEITDRKRQEQAMAQSNAELQQAKQQAEQATRAKSQFLAAMSHELRTPLNGILGYAELLALEGGLTAQQTGRIQAMRSAGQHLLQMINRVLDLSAIEAGHAAVQSAPADPRQIARDCLDLVRPSAEAAGLDLQLVAPPDVPDRLVTDPTRLRQILLNLLGNAVKFTPRGHVQLRLRVDRTEAQERRLRFEIADTGRGIPPHRRAELFREFERLGADPNEAIEGSGLGLALSARFVAMLGGRLVHADNPGGGSVFGFDLPIPQEAASGGKPPGEPAPARRAKPAATRLRVLVVDDIEMNREITSALLRAAGHQAVCAGGGVEAVAAVKAAIDAAGEGDGARDPGLGFDLVLMDLRMPDVDGLEATRRIRKLGAAGKELPVVALTAQVFGDQVESALQAGMVGHLSKPFTQEDLIAAIEKATSARPAAAPRDRPGEEEAGADALGQPAHAST